MTDQLRLGELGASGPGECQSGSADDTSGTVGAISCETGVTNENISDKRDSPNLLRTKKIWQEHVRVPLQESREHLLEERISLCLPRTLIK